MDQADVLTLFDRRMRQHADGGERIGDVVRQVGAEGDWNGIVWSGLDPATADAAIARQVRYFTALGRDFEWKLYGYDQPDDLGTRLRAAGFTPEPEESVMVAEIAELPAACPTPGLHPAGGGHRRGGRGTARGRARAGLRHQRRPSSSSPSWRRPRTPSS